MKTTGLASAIVSMWILILVAVSGWIVASMLLMVIIVLLLAFGAAQELTKEEIQDMLKNTNAIQGK